MCTPALSRYCLIYRTFENEYIYLILILFHEITLVCIVCILRQLSASVIRRNKRQRASPLKSIFESFNKEMLTKSRCSPLGTGSVEL